MFERPAQRASTGMRAEDRPDGCAEDGAVLDVLRDLEMQASGLHLADRAVEVDALSEAQHAEVDLVSRLHASTGRAVHVATSDGQDVRGTLAGAGPDWLLVEEDAGTSAVVHLPYIVLVAGLVGGAVPTAARPVSARLSLRSVLRRLGEDAVSCAVHLRGGRVLQASPARVGADFVELRQQEPAERLMVPLSAVTLVRARPARTQSR